LFFTLTGSRFSIFFLLSIVKSYFKWTLSLIRYASTFFASSSENYPWNSDSVLKISNIVKYCAIAIITLIFFTQKEIINIFLNIFFFFFYFLNKSSNPSPNKKIQHKFTWTNVKITIILSKTNILLPLQHIIYAFLGILCHHYFCFFSLYLEKLKVSFFNFFHELSL